MRAKATQKVSKPISWEECSQYRWVREVEGEPLAAVWPRGFVFEGELAVEMVEKGVAVEVTEE